ncbi:MAG: HD domain-containing protein, partial [Phycisphaerales bacterium]
MAKDKSIRELPGISPSAVVGLTRDGIVSVSDLVAADFDRVAYLVDDYNEATRLVREAAKDVPGSMPSRRSRNQESGQVGSTPVMRSPLKAVAAPKAPASRAREEAPREPVMQAALEVAARGVNLGEGAAARAMLHRRLGSACLLLEHGADEAELCAALILETAEGGGLGSEEIARRFGGAVERVIEECASLRAVPMLPSGKLPRYYVDMAGG